MAGLFAYSKSTGSRSAASFSMVLMATFFAVQNKAAAPQLAHTGELQVTDVTFESKLAAGCAAGHISLSQFELELIAGISGTRAQKLLPVMKQYQPGMEPALEQAILALHGFGPATTGKVIAAMTGATTVGSRYCP